MILGKLVLEFPYFGKRKVCERKNSKLCILLAT